MHNVLALKIFTIFISTFVNILKNFMCRYIYHIYFLNVNGMYTTTFFDCNTMSFISFVFDNLSQIFMKTKVG